MIYHSRDMAHGLGFYTAFTALIAAAFVVARRFSVQNDNVWARYSIATGIATPLLIVLGMTAFSSFAGLLSMGWLSATAWRLYK